MATNRIRELRDERGLSQSQLAAALSVAMLPGSVSGTQAMRASQLAAALGAAPDAGTIAAWEQDGSIPDEQTIVLAEFFGVAATYLLGYTQPVEEADGFDCHPRVTVLRESLGWSHKQLGDFLDVHERTIYRYERGDTSIPDETRARLCDLFGVSLDHLMGRENENELAAVIELHGPRS
jgi:transcriptional regulator with XRE-family HTH domain